MRQYSIKEMAFSGYRKFGSSKQTMNAAYPDLIHDGSGLNVVVGSISSGKTSLLEMINWACGSGLPDNDHLVINDTLGPEALPNIEVLWASAEFEDTPEINYTSKSEFRLDGRRIQADMSNAYPGPDSGENYPNSAQLIKFIRPNRVFSGKVNSMGPALYAGGDLEGRSDSINLAGIISAIRNHLEPDAILDTFREKLKEFSQYGLEAEDLRLSTPARGQGESELEILLKSGNWHNVQDLSDGAKELIWWIYELYFGDVNNYRIVCIDEIERSLHPQIQSAIMQMLHERSRHLQYFVSTHSPYVANPRLTSKIHRIDKKGVIHTATSTDFAKPSIFTVDHHRMFFEDSVLFVEGIDDLAFYSEKMKEWGYEDLTHGLFYANTKENIESFAAICDVLGIRFHAIVDDDYSDKISRLSSSSRRMLERSHEALDAAGHIKGKVDLDAIETVMAKPPKRRVSRVSEMVPGKHYRKVAARDIYPLRFGRLEEYQQGIDRKKNKVAADQDVELREIFDQIRFDRSN